MDLSRGITMADFQVSGYDSDSKILLNSEVRNIIELGWRCFNMAAVIRSRPWDEFLR